MLNPFKVEEKKIMYCVSPGFPIYEDLQRNLLKAEKCGNDGNVKKGKFVKEKQRLGRTF